MPAVCRSAGAASLATLLASRLGTVGLGAASGSAEKLQDEGIQDGRQLFLDHLPLIEKLVLRAARRQGFRHGEIEDLASWIHLKMIDDDYGILRKFRGESPLSAYLTVVILNLARDYRIQRTGKWRHSRAAQRLGVEARRLEVLIYRDGRTAEEAVETLIRHGRAEKSRSELETLIAELPHRQGTSHEGGETVDHLQAEVPDLDPVEGRELRSTLEATQAALDRALLELEAEDRLLLRLIFQDGWSLARISRHYGWPQRPLYDRRDKALRRLREGLTEAGIDWARVSELLGRAESNLEIEYDGSGSEPDSGAMDPEGPEPEIHEARRRGSGK
ncbi:MAG: sigma-70 family RNA polymerase sigma factor [Holophagales bacterium]|nr:sigma-70 family RNA polymerase sigma factor [Holophagales bacterium]